MNKNILIKNISDYFISRQWHTCVVNGKIVFTRYLTHEINSMCATSSRFYRLNEVAEQISTFLEKKGLVECHYDNIINPYKDTDFIVAALQYINHYLYGQKKVLKELIYSFQPVIRQVPCGETTQTGFLKTFINVGTVGILQDINDYFLQIEMWLDILSVCHIHISRIEIQIKPNTRVFDGVGVEISVDGHELGQCNYYEIEIDGKPVGITDIGFGLERVCWAANRWEYFAACYQSAEAYYFGLDDISDSINFIVLLISSGVVPGSIGASSILRKAIKELTHNFLRIDYRPFIKYAVSQLRSFLNPNISYEKIQNIFDIELDRAISLEVKALCKANKYEKLIGNCEQYCIKLLENKVSRAK